MAVAVAAGNVVVAGSCGDGGENGRPRGLNLAQWGGILWCIRYIRIIIVPSSFSHICFYGGKQRVCKKYGTNKNMKQEQHKWWFCYVSFPPHIFRCLRCHECFACCGTTAQVRGDVLSWQLSWEFFGCTCANQFFYGSLIVKQQHFFPNKKIWVQHIQWKPPSIYFNGWLAIRFQEPWICSVGEFYGFYHGIHHHFSPPFGEYVSNDFDPLQVNLNAWCAVYLMRNIFCLFESRWPRLLCSPSNNREERPPYFQGQNSWMSQWVQEPICSSNRSTST